LGKVSLAQAGLSGGVGGAEPLTNKRE